MIESILTTFKKFPGYGGAGFAVAVVATLLFAALLAAKPAVAQETIVEDRNYTVEEFFAGVYTDLRIRRGDRVVFTASGTIWPAGRFNPFFPSTGPEGYPDSPDCGNPDSNWPAPCERKFSLLGRIDDQVAADNEGWFYIGGGRELVYTATQQGFLDLNHNDDVSGNGEGAFEVNVKVYRDITPPNTTITSAPPSLINSRQASFAFSSSEANSTFECRATRQGQTPAAFSACTSPRELTNLIDGSYAFEVRAKDAVGNVDGSPASYVWTVDATAPTVENVNPADGATSIRRNTNVTATFLEAMDPKTLVTTPTDPANPNAGTSTTFQLFKGDPTVTTPVPTIVTVSEDGKTVTLDPSVRLAKRKTYTAKISGAKDKAGNALPDKVWSFKTGRR